LLFKTNRFSRLFPTVGSQIITEPRSPEDFPVLEGRVIQQTLGSIIVSKVNAS
jgi:hypothetical protein